MIIKMTLGEESKELDLTTFMVREGEECETLTGWTSTEWNEQFIRDRADAVAFGWYLACKRSGDDVEFSTVLDTLDMAKLGYELVERESGKADKPAELGAEEGPFGPEPTAGETKVKKAKSSTGNQSSSTSTA